MSVCLLPLCTSDTGCWPLDSGFCNLQSNLYSVLYTKPHPRISKKINIFSCFRAHTIGIFFCMLLPSTRIQTSPAIKTPAQLHKIRHPEIAPYDSWLFNNDLPKKDISKQLLGPDVFIGFVKGLPGHTGPFCCKDTELNGINSDCEFGEMWCKV